MHRQVVGLKWARSLAERPRCIPKGWPRGPKAYGIRYEKALLQCLPGSAEGGRWFEFEDLNGHGYCQVDVLMPLGSRNGERQVLVLEAKYTWVPQGHSQIDELYRPVVEASLGREVVGVVVCKRLVPGMEGLARVCESLDEAVRQAPLGPVVWHWIAPVGKERRGAW